ncbi:receptor-type tyrosine-protein phosphatase delta-like isoform X1 [Synchiropus splendidus]|uniref:receptor-type tyrosine-protein phosphatase delta-like isoform X1 n=1 Tax=Synchiropus splendidus TaxID=270530 RepID=UPI00237EDFAA|nr:receptor-type tyrosine-protein phosphatase delta-like isoform X1 [Synchiropus splendidus]XP_053715383.1 receptor-type tyrosine-protein phosphatase delta-like isoform X1 [Synchiropus splendidus]XP_053715384.1 receptor-type tyrosine-protein phosphatase delta-like isoform X1 [Synchiropus splendidus]XP_053715385.1 receptor-type tyrosine-protein phosphatase delta-like isoform X1 [Synchiropus splendidus]XP_053715388.1 receptor-type tyrosine-protein phosphatase delta-like isoform X1 [Synchiropus sp
MLLPSCPTMRRARPSLLLWLLLVLVLLLHLTDAQTPPKFLRTPNDQTGVQGGVASFICQASGDPRPKIVWNKKGKKVSNQRFEVVIEFDDGSGSVLRIQPLRTPRDEAIYECVASNSVGETSATTRLTVLREDQLPPGFPTIDMGPQLKVVERTRTATMLCAASGNPDPDITWFKDFLPVNTTNNNGRIKQLRSGGTPIRGALQIEQSEESDQGKYECVATNNDGTRYSAPANLYVRELREVRRVPPRFSIPPTDNEIMPGGSVNITCVAVGSPMPYVKWMLGAEDLTPEDDMPIGRNVLELTDVRQSANYTCVAMSTLGVIEAVAQITVKALPKAPGIPVVTERTATSITLTWDSGNPEPVSYYIIQHKSKYSDDLYKEIDGVATTRYSVGGLSPYSDYEFRILAVNNIGRGPSSESVEAKTAEQAPSTAPRQVRGHMMSTTTAVIHWDEPEEANGQIMGYRVYYTMEPTQHVNLWEKQIVRGSNFVTIQGLIPNKTYNIKVLAYTSVGDGPLSPDLQIIAKTGVPSQPTDFRGEAKSETSILLSWVAPAQTGQENQITGYELMYRKRDDKDEKHVSFEPTTTYFLKDLKPFTTYTFRLAARSKHGVGAYTNEVSAETPQTHPSGPPQEVRCFSPSSTSLLVSWQPPTMEVQNGLITKYTIQYVATEGEDVTTHQIASVPPESSQYLLENLEKWTEYHVTVTAHTEVGAGPESLPLLVRTEEDVPSGPPRKVEVEAVNSSSIKVIWRSPMPTKQHGQIRGYQVHYVRMVNGEPTGQPVIKDILMDDAQWEFDDTTDHEMIITELQAETTYSVTVAAYTTKGDGARSKPKLITTTGAVPEKPRLMVSPTNMGTALLQWHPPAVTHGPLQGYRLRFGRKDLDPLTVIEFPERENHYTTKEIHKGASYTFRLSARNKVGFGEETVKEITTNEDVPSGYPQSITAEGATTTTTRVNWEPVILAERNGQIVKYALQYKDINSPRSPSELFITAPESTVILDGLKAETTYDIKMCAFTSKGSGPYSPSVQFRTQPLDQAVFAKNFHVRAAMKTSVLLTWEIPDTYNAAQPFTILYDKGQSVEVDGKLTQKLITGLQPETQYSFLLTNRGNSAGGLQHRVSTMTAPDILRTKPYLIRKTNSDGMATVALPLVQTSGTVWGYYIVVVPLKKQQTGKFFKPWDNPDEMNLEELLKEINQTRQSFRVRRQAEPKPYIAAYFKELPKDFTLGDGKVYGEFENRQLQNSQEYIFFVLAAMEMSENIMYATSPYSDPVVSADIDPQPIIDEEEGLIWVVGPVLAVLFIICIVIAILLYKSSKPDRKRAESDARKSSLPNSKEMLLHNLTDPVELRRLNFQTPGTSTPSHTSNLHMSSMANHPPIPIMDLADHLERLKANDNLKFSQEYESIDPGQQFTWEHSNLEVNKPKNRYANVIAYDHSRVLLTAVDGIPGSDYINANYIDGYRKQNAYIATQGALPETFGEFWRMIWEQRSSIIVMMTKLEERSRVKCDQYWPTRGTETYGLIQVTLLDTVELATYCVRTFALYKNGSSEKREVRQFQFTAWPDHGVPEHPTPFLAFLRRVKACNPPDAGPMVVHCSAGVGRTGCFIVIDAMMERIKHEKTVDIYGHVTLMRAQRNYMVQTEDQYTFTHDALQEAVNCGTTEVPARNLYAYIQKLTQIEGGENVTGMELEFKRLANTKAHTSRFISANLPCNKFKNRLVNIMPYESTRVCLQPIRGVEGSDYINASFIDGYRQQKAYIATQGPLAETTEDFWRMLWEHNSTIVVMLTKLREMGREKCHQYWPAERSARYQYFVVDPMAEYNMPQYILREFKVTDARDGQSRTVRQFQFTDWPEQGVPKSGEGFIDFIGQVHKTKEQFGQDGPISVHCSAGVGRTGVFITLSIVLERMRYEGVVDIFQTVKMLRTQRPAMVQTEDQYQFCYRAGLEYLGSFDHYAT